MNNILRTICSPDFFFLERKDKQTDEIVNHCLIPHKLLWKLSVFLKKKNIFTILRSPETSVKSRFLKNQRIQKIEKIEGGFSNNLWKVDTINQSYIFRSPKEKILPSNYKHILEIIRSAAAFKIAPELIGENFENQQMLLGYIDHHPWPSYDKDPGPYKSTMQVLKFFHKNMRIPLTTNEKNFYPFSMIFTEGEWLSKLPNMPKHFLVALKEVEDIFERLKPWLQNHAACCHGDFHKGNVLLPKEQKETPKLIDFDSVSLGDPLFDVVKFSVSMNQKHRLELFYAYLGRLPTPQENAHFELMNLVLLMVVAIVRFRSAYQKKSSEYLSKEELERLLNSKEPLPSFLNVPFGDTSTAARQKGAIYALDEFLRKTEELSFSEMLADLEN